MESKIKINFEMHPLKKEQKPSQKKPTHRGMAQTETKLSVFLWLTKQYQTL